MRGGVYAVLGPLQKRGMEADLDEADQYGGGSGNRLDLHLFDFKP